MAFIVTGLGNPGEEYKNTRHNTGRMAVERVQRELDFPEFRVNSKRMALVSEGKIGKEVVMLLLPESFMNKSGASVGSLAGKTKQLERLIVVHDDLDLPLGRFKISFGKHSGGHKGVESIMRAVKSIGFIRIRIGISPVTPSGKLKKPRGEEHVTKHILGRFKKSELMLLAKQSKAVAEVIQTIVKNGLEAARSRA